MSSLLVLSTYELGVRPLGATVPAGALVAAGHEVLAVDLSLQEWPTGELDRFDGVVLSVPMHTALRLGLDVLRRLREEAPAIPVLCHGLYAEAIADAAGDLLGPGDLAAAGEVAEAIVAWAERLGEAATAPAGRLRSLGVARPAPRPPQRRAGLPGLDAYARLQIGDEERLVGSVETTTGCNHTCRHCPVPVVYEGRSRPVALSSVLAEVDALVEEGAQHLHFADPDFYNRPAHARAVVKAVHGRHPSLTLDATIKVSHLLSHREDWPALAAQGLTFVVSALESTSDLVLERLDKGHSALEGAEAVRLLRQSGVEPRPSFLPFTPWTTRADVIELLDFVAAEDLVWNVEPVQYGIRLLLPPGSLLLNDPDEALAESLIGADPTIPGTAWRSLDPLLDECQLAVAAEVESLAAAGADPETAYDAVRRLVHTVIGRADAGRPVPALLGPPGHLRPRLTEAWFCCAEPTSTQRSALAARGAPVPLSPTRGPVGAR